MSSNTALSPGDHLSVVIGDLDTDRAIVLQFLNALQLADGAQLWARDVDAKGMAGKSFAPDRYGAALDWVVQQNASRNVYFHFATPTPEALALMRQGKKPRLSKQDVQSVSWLWVDIDPPAGVDLDAWQIQAIAALEEFRLPPTIIIKSGGGVWGLYQLAAPFEVRGDLGAAAFFEARNRGLAKQFASIGGDKCFSVDHVARLPGTINHPDAKKRAAGRKTVVAQLHMWQPERVYKLEDFDAIAVEASASKPARLLDVSTLSRIGSLDEVTQFADGENARLRLLIEKGEPAEGEKSYPSRSEAVFAATCKMIRAGVPDEIIVSIVTDERFGISAHVLKAGDCWRRALRLLQNAHAAIERSSAEFVINERGKIIAKHMGNVRLAVERLGVVPRRNLLSGEIIIDGLPDIGPIFDDGGLTRLRASIEVQFKFLPEKELLADVVSDMARDNEFHPIQEYLDGLDWDGVARLDTWMSRYIGAEQTEFNGAAGRAFLIAAVRRVRRPGTKFDEMIVFEGEQGTFKSTALSVLARKPEWFCDDAPLGSNTKELMEAVSGAWIVEVPELFAVKKGDIDRIKQVLAKTHDKARMAYARYEVSRPRGFVFAGTTNSDHYLTDPTGNRRFWPIKTGKIDIAALKHDADQLWAEAAHLEALGHELFLPSELRASAAEAQLQRVAEDPWISPVRDKLSGKFGKIKPADLMAIIGKPTERQGGADARRLSDVMKTLGWSREKQRFPDVGAIWCFARRDDKQPGGRLAEIVVRVVANAPGEAPSILVSYAVEKF